MDKADPHRFLGLHDNGKRVTLYAPDQEKLSLEVLGEKVWATALGDALFEYLLGRSITLKDYLITHPNGRKALENRGCDGGTILRSSRGSWGEIFCMGAPCKVGFFSRGFGSFSFLV